MVTQWTVELSQRPTFGRGLERHVSALLGYRGLKWGCTLGGDGVL